MAAATKFFQGVKLIDSDAGDDTPIGVSGNPLPSAMYVFSASLLDWVPWDGSGGGGGGAATIADGADVAEGSKADAAWSGVAASASGISIWKYMGQKLEAIRLAIVSTPAVSVSNLPATQPISAVALPLPAGAATELGNLATIAGKDFATQVTAAAILAKLSGDPATQTTLAAILAKIVAAPALEGGNLATLVAKDFATQTTLAAVKADVDKIPALGQALAAASVPVVLTAAQQTALTPPAAIAGFALEAGHLATIDTSTAKIPALGQALAAGSVPVVLTAAQQAALTPPAAIAGFALEAGHLAAIDTATAKIPAQGQALAAGSMPVVLTAAQQAALTPPAAIAGYALEAGHLASLDAKDFATQVTLAAVLAKIIAAPATEAKQDTANTSLASVVASTGVAGLDLAAYGTELYWLSKINTALGTLAKDATLKKLAPVPKPLPVQSTLMHRM